jgi:imidazolonepropionase
MRCDRIWRNARLATLVPGREQLGLVEDGLIACRDGRIGFAGPARAAPSGLEALQVTDCAGRLITPGLIDCHTHLVHAGNRAAEFEQRLLGASYESIARQGGGILSTVRATRAASESELLAQSRPRLDALIAEGVTTVEIKSGYGLTTEHEGKQLRVARYLARECSVTVVKTFLGAHALPPEYAGRANDYIARVCNDMLPILAREGLVDAVDVFCENIGFTREQARRVFETARSLRLPVKLHAEQLSNMQGAELAAQFDALSADHLEHADESAVRAMAAAGTAAVLLPGAFYFLRETRLPPIDLLRAHGVPIAIATDCNPGTSPLTSILLAMNLAATLFRLTVEECLVGVTRAAARALGLEDRGTLEAGKRCDLAIWNIEHPAELVYRMGFNPLHARVVEGQ